MCVRVGLVAFLLLAACGGGHDATFDRNRDACAKIVDGTTSLADVASTYGDAFTVTRNGCLTNWAPDSSTDTCPYGPTQPICEYEFQYVSSDGRACKGGPGGGGACGYGCAVRTAGEAPADLRVQVCAHAFLTGQ